MTSDRNRRTGRSLLCARPTPMAQCHRILFTTGGRAGCVWMPPAHLLAPRTSVAVTRGPAGMHIQSDCRPLHRTNQWPVRSVQPGSSMTAALQPNSAPVPTADRWGIKFEIAATDASKLNSLNSFNRCLLLRMRTVHSPCRFRVAQTAGLTHSARFDGLRVERCESERLRSSARRHRCRRGIASGWRSLLPRADSDSAI